MPSSTDRANELLLLGGALYISQKVEFAMYGIAAHLAHLPEAQGDRRLKNLTGEKFLRGDPSELKVTLGQLVKTFKKRLLLASADLDQFVADRNLIAHNYFRHFHTSFNGQSRVEGAEDFLLDFVTRSESFLSVLEGLIVFLKEAFAKKEGRTGELQTSVRDINNKAAYVDYVTRHQNVSASV